MRDFLRRQIETACREELGAVSIRRLCPRCASDQHGRPSLRVGTGPAPYVSWSYADNMAVLAWTHAGPIGVDLERIGESAEELTGWTRTEALLKATGEGITAEPTETGTMPRPAHWSVELDLPDGYVGHAVVLGMPDGPPAEAPVLSWLVLPETGTVTQERPATPDG